jgi:poly-gamma-glutamate synthesis protein (capsule biosynthesis protein)
VCSYGQDNDLIDISFYPIVIGGEYGLKDRLLESRLVPHLATGGSAERILRRFKEQSASLGVQIELEGGIGILRI